MLCRGVKSVWVRLDGRRLVTTSQNTSVRDSTFKGRIVQGTRIPRKGSSKGRIVQGTLRTRDAMSKGRNVQGMHRPRDAASKGCIVQGTEHSRLFARGHIGQEHFILRFPSLLDMMPPGDTLARRWRRLKKRCSFSSSGDNNKLVRSKSFTEQAGLEKTRV
jgi:hypothetical protein